MPCSTAPRTHSWPLRVVALSLLFLAAVPAWAEGDSLDFERLAAIRTVRDVAISPDGSLAAYILDVPRVPGVDEDGTAWRELHVVPTAGGESRAWIHGHVRVSEIGFTPDSRWVTYLAKREGDDERSLWAVPVDGGESVKLLEHTEAISGYRISPDGARVAFLATEAESDERSSAKDKGYKQEVFEEDWREREVWIADLPAFRPEPVDPSADAVDEEDAGPRELDVEGSVFNVEWMPDGSAVALGVAPRPLIDDRYMLRRIRVVDVEDGTILGRLENPGKLGAFEPSPDGARIAMISAADPNDPSEGRLLVGRADGGPLQDMLPDFEGHVRHLAWQDARTVMFVADEGVETWFGEVDVETRSRKVHLRSGPDTGEPVFTAFDLSQDGTRAIFRGETPAHPREVFAFAHGQRTARRLTVSNPWLDDVRLAPQEVIRWNARDGLELEGVLIRPRGDASRSAAPLLLMVHGGPESHDRNGWVTNYSRPGQLAAANGYAVLYPNYRGSTGRGVAFSKRGQGDAAGPEFDDLVDAVDHLIKTGVADRSRVGILGGSYGGYATAWCSTRYTDRFRAGVMFVGISNKVSKGLTTEIPIEDKMVHTLFDPWTKWDFSLERSPVFHAEKSRTALLIAGGTADSRVHPSQSLQLYRALKLIGRTPVRYVRYPGEGHGNTKAAARDDYTRRLMRWMDHFVMNKGSDLPPWDLPPDLGDEESEAGD